MNMSAGTSYENEKSFPQKILLKQKIRNLHKMEILQPKRLNFWKIWSKMLRWKRNAVLNKSVPPRKQLENKKNLPTCLFRSPE